MGGTPPKRSKKSRSSFVTNSFGLVKDMEHVATEEECEALLNKDDDEI